jgi:hypothetical protein
VTGTSTVEIEAAGVMNKNVSDVSVTVTVTISVEDIIIVDVLAVLTTLSS